MNPMERYLNWRTYSFMAAHAVFSFFMGNMLGLHGTKLWVLRGALFTLGLAAFLAIVWYVYNKRKAEAAGNAPVAPAAAGAAGGDDMDALIREAGAKLTSRKLGNLPTIFLVGEGGAAKTSTMVHSGLDPELLAGQVYQETNLVPTRAANLWFAQNAVFVEAAGKSVAEAGAWAKIAKKLQPGRLGSVVSKEQAPRAALVMIEAESLNRQGATEALAATARTLRARLGEIAESLGINLPVYVLFTKTDRVPFFPEFVRNLTNEEAVQVLGVTVPVITSRKGIYAEEEAARLTAAFEDLFRSLANARPMLLAREHDADKLPGTYEFPREFRKLRATLVQFLVDLCRPSQLAAGPFLRGFYFSGVRPVVVNEAAPAPAMRQPQRDREAAVGATQLFRAGAMGQMAQGAAPQVMGTRKVPQWLFLSHFFHNLLLSDQVAMGASGASTKTSLLRRVVLGSLAGLALLYSIALLVSYSKNHALETGARDAAQGIAAVDASGPGLASPASLQRLESLRQSLLVLTRFEREGAPWSYHWGLYTGDALYPQVRQLYFTCFRQALFGQTQAGLLDSLRGLPATPGPDYQPTYETLKAYLITTSNHDKSTRDFLGPVLLNRWSAGRNVDAERAALAQKQFDFYSEELKIANPYSSDNDAGAVKKAREYLKQFEGIERVYAAMLADAAKKGQPINFNRQFPGSAAVVVDGYEVASPFTKKGFDFMKTALKDPSKYFSGEEWVLGPQAPTKMSTTNLGQQLAARYYADYVKQWRAYLRAANVVRFASVGDAAKKLGTLSENTSPLLALFSLASQNTDVDAQEVKSVFQPVQAVVPASNGDRLIAPSNQPYMSALLKLQSSVEQAAAAPQLTDTIAAPTLAAAMDAKTTTGSMAQTFTPDKEGADAGRVDRRTQQLLEDPITSVQALLKGLGPAELNAKGAGFCSQYRALLAKYPFNPSATAQATVADVNGIFLKPDGALWAFYNATLAKFLTKQGSQYVATPGTGLNITPAFLNFFNSAAGFSDTIYAGNTQDPHISYSLKPVASEGFQSVGLQLDGQTFTYSGGDAAAKQFKWQGTGPHEAKATVKFGGGPDLAWSDNDGLWAIFHFFDKAERWQPSGNGYTLEWVIRIGKDAVKLPSGAPLTVRFQLDMNGAPPVFQKGYLGRMACVATVAK